MSKSTPVPRSSQISGLSGTRAEANLYPVSNNWMGDKGVKYQTTAVAGKSPVTIKGERIEFKLPASSELARRLAAFQALQQSLALTPAAAEQWIREAAAQRKTFGAS